MVNTKIRLTIVFVAEDGEALYRQQKQDWELTVTHILTVCMEKKEKGLMSLMAEGKVDDYLQWYIQSTSPDARH